MEPDDPSVLDEDRLYRWLPDAQDPAMFVFDQGTGERVRISSGAFGLHDDGCSVYLHGVLADHGLGPKDLVREPRRNVVLELQTAAIREVNLGVARDPNPPGTDGHDRHKAHALIVHDGLGKKTLVKACRKLAQQAAVVLEP